MIHRLAYGLIKAYSTLCIYLLFDKIEVFGKEHVPDGPLIFAPNHQNAFIDGVITSCLARKNVSFLARADVFKVNALKPLLRFFRIVPVYRLRDGASEMSKNYATFSAVQEHLGAGNSILIFPEGNQKFMRYLRPLKKGIFRIIDQCQKNEKLPKVVPVGLNYEHHTRTGYNLIVHYAPAISYTFPLSNGFVKEREELRESMRPLTQQIGDYDLQCLSESAWLDLASYSWKGIQKEKSLIELENDERFMNDLRAWRALAFENKLLPAKALKARHIPTLVLVVLVYLFIAPFRILVKAVMKKITSHKSFRLSMTFAFTLFFAPLYLFLMYGLFQLFLPGIYFLLVVIGCFFFAKNKRVLDQFNYWWRLRRLRKEQSEKHQRFIDLGLALKKQLISIQSQG
ncbi:MAG: 1-acyl-sn-glycerol-3-phosphate acyltransferase [Bacteroidota bacterium]